LNKERETVLNEYLYSLTPEAMKELKNWGMFSGDRFKPPKLSMSGKYHDLDVIDLRLLIESDANLAITDWKTDYGLACELSKRVQNQSRTNNHRVPDGKFVITSGDFRRPFILEYIRHDYSKDRYHKVLSNIEYYYPFESVLIVGSVKSKMERYYKWLQHRMRNRFPGKYAFTYKDSILQSTGLSGAEIIKGDGSKPKFQHLHAPEYDPEQKDQSFSDGYLHLEKRGIDHIKANIESQNY